MLDLFSACYSNVLSFCSLLICCNLRNCCTTQSNYRFICLIFSGPALRTGLSWGREHFFCWAQLGVSSAGPAGITHAAGVAQLGPQSHVWLSHVVLTLFTGCLIFKEMRAWASPPTAVFQDDDSRSCKSILRTKLRHLQQHFVILLVKAGQKASLDLEGGEGNFTAWWGEWQSIIVKGLEYGL